MTRTTSVGNHRIVSHDEYSENLRALTDMIRDARAHAASGGSDPHARMRSVKDHFAWQTQCLTCAHQSAQIAIWMPDAEQGLLATCIRALWLRDPVLTPVEAIIRHRDEPAVHAAYALLTRKYYDAADVLRLMNGSGSLLALERDMLDAFLGNVWTHIGYLLPGDIKPPSRYVS